MKVTFVSVLAVSALSLAALPATAQTVRGVTKTEIVIGMHTDMSGPVAAFGKYSANGMRMRAEEINEAGGINGRKIKLIVEDTQYQVPRAVQAGNKLLNRDNVFLMASALGTPQNNAVLKDQLAANVPNMFPVTAARQMAEPFHKLKFAALGSYYDQIRAGVKYFVEQRGRKAVCILYQDTEFGEEIRDGVMDQAKAMNFKVVETATNKPTDTDLTAQVTKLRAANCDLVALGTIVRDSIVPYVTARKMGWTNVEFLGTSATYIGAVAEVPGGATTGLHTMAGTIMPSRKTAPANVVAWMDKYKTKYGDEPNVASVYGYSNMDMIATGIRNAGPNLTVDSFVGGMEKITGYRDMFGGPTVSFGPNKRAGTSAAFMFVVKGGEWQLVNQEPMIY